MRTLRARHLPPPTPGPVSVPTPHPQDLCLGNLTSLCPPALPLFLL